MRNIVKFRDMIDGVIEKITVVFIAFIPLAIFLQVVLRTFGIGIQWSEEMSRYCYVMLIFLGSITAVSQGKHIRITLLNDLLPQKAQKIFYFIIHVIMGLFMCACTYGATQLIASTKGVVSSSLPWFHMNYLYFVVLVSCAMMAANCFFQSILILKEYEQSV